MVFWDWSAKQGSKQGSTPITLHHADVVNLVDVRENSYEHRVKEFVLDQGIDFIFESFSRTLKIRVRYSKVLHRCPLS
jgi:hypothetical protein